MVNLKSQSSISRTVDVATAASVTVTYVWHHTQLYQRWRMYGTASYVSCDVGGFTIFLLYSSIFRFIINVVVFDQFHFNSPCFTLCRHNNEHFIIFQRNSGQKYEKFWVLHLVVFDGFCCCTRLIRISERFQHHNGNSNVIYERQRFMHSIVFNVLI